MPRPLIKLAVRVLVFLLPLGVFYLVMMGVSLHSGEALPLSMVVEGQTYGDPYLYGASDNRTSFAYKLLSVQAHQPDVMVLGSSRMLQFRREFFNRQPEAFYNASVQGMSIRDAEIFLDHLTDAQFPETLILGVDLIVFASSTDPFPRPPALHMLAFDVNDVINGHNRVMQHWFQGKIDFSRLMERTDPLTDAPVFGLRALSYAQGFRPDGSLQRGDLIADPARAVRDQENESLEAYEGLTIGDLNGLELESLERVLTLLHAHDVTVIGVEMPYSPSAYERMIVDDNDHVLTAAAARVAAIFAAHDTAFFNFSDPASLEVSTPVFMDSAHSSEVVALRAYLRVVDALPDALNVYTDADTLEASLENAINPFEVFPPSHGT